MLFFSEIKETILHLYFGYYAARFVWRVVHVEFGSQPPNKEADFLGLEIHHHQISFSKSINQISPESVLV